MTTVIHRNTFENYSEAVNAVSEFPYCGGCNAGVKISEVAGTFIAHCVKRPGFAVIEGVPVFKHNGIRKGAIE